MQHFSIVMVCLFLFTANAFGAAIRGTALGIAATTPDFWSIEYVANSGTESVGSLELILPAPGFFDFDGSAAFAMPVFSSNSIGLSAFDVSFQYTGTYPTSLVMMFTPGSFEAGDELRFAAPIDGFGSQLGGAVGAFGGTELKVTLADGSTGSLRLVTDTSVASTGFVDISTTPIPEPSFALITVLFGVAASCRRSLQRK